MKTPRNINLRVNSLLLALLFAFISVPSARAQDGMWDDMSDVLGDVQDLADALSDTGIDAVDQTMDAISSGIGLMDDFGFLSPEDGGFAPNPDDPNAPDLPSDCLESGDGSCLPEALERLDRVRLALENLAAIYRVTMWKYNSYVNLADAASGFHGLSKAAWAVTKIQVDKDYLIPFNTHYDDKAESIIGVLNETLLQIDACEAQCGTENWYQLYGMPYYLYMRDKYRRK